jgi:MFS family permease
VLEALKIRDFRYLWGGRLVSSMGSWLLVVALPAFVFRLTGSLLATGLTMVAEYLPGLVLGPIAGVLTDRWDRRRVMIGSDIFRAITVLVLFLATSNGSLWLAYLALLAESTGAMLFRPAAQATTPAIVGTGSALSSAVSLNSITDGTVRLVGPPVGAVILSLAGLGTLLWIDAASYLVSVAAVLCTTRHPRPETRERSTVRRVLVDLGAGLRLLGGQPVARVLLPLSTVFLLANAALGALLVPFGVRRLGGAEQISVVVSALGIGFLVGAVAVRWLVDRVQPKYLLAASQLATAGGFFFLFDARSLPVAVVAAVGVGIFGSLTLATPQTALQRVVPNAALGRISSVFFAGEALATLVGALVGPALADALSLATTAVFACVLTAVGALVGLIVVPVAAALLPARDDDVVAASSS